MAKQLLSTNAWDHRITTIYVDGRHFITAKVCNVRRFLFTVGAGCLIAAIGSVAAMRDTTSLLIATFYVAVSIPFFVNGNKIR